MSLEPCLRHPDFLKNLSYSQGAPATVEQLLLPGFVAYARILNPATTAAGLAIRWSEVGQVEVQATTQWGEIVPEKPLDPQMLNEPKTGNLDQRVAAQLARHLALRTTTPNSCFFLVWEGYSELRSDVSSAPTVDLPPYLRRMHILTGDVEDANESIAAPPSSRLPTWWMPADGAWCVGNDVYGRSVFVGGSVDVIADVLGDPLLEAYSAEPDQLLVNEDF